MEKQNDKKIKERVGTILFNAMQEIISVTKDESYAEYLVFSIVGSVLLQRIGEKKLNGVFKALRRNANTKK